MTAQAVGAVADQAPFMALVASLDWVVAGAVAVSLYVLLNMWLTGRQQPPAAPSTAAEPGE